jgi:benzoate-CoA ligase
MRHGAVLEAAVVGRIDADGLTRTLAYVVLKSGQSGDTALAGALQAFVKDQLAPHKYPREIRFLAELPKTATGKIQRFKLRERAAG